MAGASQAEAAKAILLSRTDPVGYLEWLFDIHFWDAQKAMIVAYFTKRETAVRSSHESGKTYALAACTVGDLITQDEEIIVTLAAKEEQLKNTLWAEVPGLIARCRVKPLPKPLTLRWQITPKCYMVGETTDNPTTLQGKHAEKVRVIVDEAAGVENVGIFEALRSLGADARKHSFFYSMNPTRSEGPEVDLFRRPRVHAIHIDAFDSPNFLAWFPEGADTADIANEVSPRERRKREAAGETFVSRPITEAELIAMDEAEGGPLDYATVPHLISRRYAREVYDDHGTGPASPWWPRVRGEFPQQDLDSLIFREWINAAIRLPLPPSEWEGYPITVGLDVAGAGSDETAFYARRGPRIIGRGAWKEPDDRRAAAILRIQMAEYLAEPGTIINIDSAVIGHYLALYLTQLGLRVNPINVGDPAYDKEHFANRRAEAFWALRERFKAAAGEEADKKVIAGVIDPICQEQLTKLRYEINGQNQIVIETKKAAKKRGIGSPDRADALMLCFCPTPERQERRDFRVGLGYEREQDESPKPSRFMERRRATKWERQRREWEERMAARTAGPIDG